MNWNLKRPGLPAVWLLLVACTIAPGEGAALAAGPPDPLYAACVNTIDRAQIRAERAICDDVATSQAYNIGIFRPCTPEEEDRGGTCEIVCACPPEGCEVIKNSCAWVRPAETSP